MQAYLTEGGPVEQRVHVWHGSLTRPGIRGFGDCHDHRFSFVSEVLAGQVFNTVWDVEYDPGGAFDVYQVEHARAARDRTGSHDGQCHVIARARASCAGRYTTCAGQAYEFERRRFHQTEFGRGVTVTLITKFNQQSTPARILCPHGAPLVHAFGDPLPERDVAEIISLACDALQKVR